MAKKKQTNVKREPRSPAVAPAVAPVAVPADGASDAPVNALTQRALSLIGITMLIAAVLAVLLARTITAPVQQLVKSAEEIGRGGHSLRLREHRTDRRGAR